jgi:hypothetical protein
MAGTLAAVLGVAIGCVHRQTNASVLAPLPSFFENSFFGDSIQPQYLDFDDELTEAVFKDLARSGRYKIVPSRTGLLCPANPSAGRHGYLLQTQVNSLMGDTAVVTMRRNCLMPGQSIQQSEFILLRRRHGKWQLEKVIGGSMEVLAANPAAPRHQCCS